MGRGDTHIDVVLLVVVGVALSDRVGGSSAESIVVRDVCEREYKLGHVPLRPNSRS